MHTKVFLLKQVNDIKTYGIQELLRKICLLIKVLLVIPINIIAIVPCIIIRLISPWIIVRIEKVPSSNFGNFVIFLIFQRLPAYFRSSFAYNTNNNFV